MHASIILLHSLSGEFIRRFLFVDIVQTNRAFPLLLSAPDFAIEATSRHLRFCPLIVEHDRLQHIYDLHTYYVVLFRILFTVDWVLSVESMSILAFIIE